MNGYFRAVFPLLRFIKIILFFLIDSIRYAKYSNSVMVNSSKKRMISNLIYQYHTIEKGLVMPNRRWNFGAQKIRRLVEDCNYFIDKYGKNNDELRIAIGVLKTYLEEHSKHGITVPHDIVVPIHSLCNRVTDTDPVPQIKKTNKEFFSSTNSKFIDFVQSRASVRNYSKVPVPIEDIIHAIDIAKSSPSACNRQPTRVYIIQDRKKIDRVLYYQNGNKGFGHLTSKLLILTTELSSFRGAAERNLGWIDCGIFSMNLMYALHYLHIGCCPLNAGFNPTIERKMKKLCEIPPEEAICLLMTCGFVPNSVDLTKSTRKQTQKLIRVR